MQPFGFVLILEPGMRHVLGDIHMVHGEDLAEILTHDVPGRHPRRAIFFGEVAIGKEVASPGADPGPLQIEGGDGQHIG
jgi:hypothetical protein